MADAQVSAATPSHLRRDLYPDLEALPSFPPGSSQRGSHRLRPRMSFVYGRHSSGFSDRLEADVSAPCAAPGCAPRTASPPGPPLPRSAPAHPRPCTAHSLVTSAFLDLTRTSTDEDFHVWLIKNNRPLHEQCVLSAALFCFIRFSHSAVAF